MSEIEVLPATRKINIQDALNEIQVSWKKTTDAICETADILFKYRSSPNWSEIEKELEERHIIKISVQKFLIGIAQNRTLMNPKYRELLPPHYNSLYHLSRIKKDKLENLLEKGEIHQDLDLMSARGFALKYAKQNNKSRTTSSDTAQAIITMKFPKSRGAKTQVNEAIKLLRDSFPDVEIELKSFV